MFIYNLLIRLYYLAILATSVFKPKAKLWITGRKNYFENLSTKLSKREGKLIWMHCASVGEFEQGRPVLEEVRKSAPEIKILLTFFSPSGYEGCKNYGGADYIVYLPFDSKSNAKKFLDIAKPDLIIFVKYEFWINFLNVIAQRKIPALLISAVFREDQHFFKWYGKIFANSLAAYKQIFVQDDDSKRLLNEIGVKHVVVNGDTRYDRVAKIASENSSISEIEKFCENKVVIVAGSTWDKDEELLIEIFRELVDKKMDLTLIIVPHEINEAHLNRINSKLLTYFSKDEINWFSKFDIHKQTKVLVVDAMGILSKIYKHATVSYLGGGFEDGIHNILEAAVYGNPIIFGPNYHKFNEARQMIQLNCAWSISSKEELKRLLVKLLIDDVQSAKTASEIAQQFVSKNVGATKEVLKFVFDQNSGLKKHV